MSLKEKFENFASSYMTNTYRGDKRAFDRIQEYFQKLGRYTEDEWTQSEAGSRKAVFAKGSSTKMPFDPESPLLEVMAIVKYSQSNSTITVTVGHKSWEARRARARYGRLLAKIDAYIADEKIAVRLSEEAQAT